MNFLKEKSIYFILFFTFLFFIQGVVKLPVMDRDEARFATASKTMMETKNFVDIKMHDEVRYKKPIGIYWLQSISNYFFGNPPYNEIWVYRLPSIIGVILSIFFIYNFVRKEYGHKDSILCVYFLILPIITISEVHQAKTDSFLFLTVVTSNLILIKGLKDNYLSLKNKLLFWFISASGVLIKGPIIFVFTILPLSILSIFKKKNYFKIIWTLRGFLLFLLISVPWFVAITIISDGLFWHESAINDLFSKVRSGQESHGFPPGYYSILMLLMFWPGVIFIPVLLNKIFKDFKLSFLKKDYEIFIFFWFIIPLILYELIPTKLPHYIFPSYAALSILLSSVVGKSFFSEVTQKFSFFILCFYPICFLIAQIFIVNEYSNIDISLWLITFLGIFTLVMLIINFYKKDIFRLIFSACIFQAIIYFSAVYYLIPKLEILWVSEKINSFIDKKIKNVDKVLLYGFNEPSLTFLTSHKAIKKNIIDYNLKKNEKILYIVTNQYSSFIKKKSFNEFKLIQKFEGFNYSQGKKVEINFFEN
ncbi:MAG: hypothetical protein CMM98_04860 [Rickettsiales bacterium]|nr:hypothetical protein [Rickettsiales bacterium]